MYIYVAAKRSLSAHNGYTVHVLIIAAFHSADYFASRTCYILAQAAIIIDRDEKNSEMRN